MKKIINHLLILLFLIPGFENINAQKPEYVIVIHGGAGVITRQNLSPGKERHIAKS